MKLLDINGRDISIIPPVFTSSFNQNSRSKLQKTTREKIINRFPQETIYEDFNVPGSRLSVDFFLYKRKLVIEVDGKQHQVFSAFHHGDRTVEKKFAKQTNNDVRKSNWCDINGFKLIRVVTEKDLGQLDE